MRTSMGMLILAVALSSLGIGCAQKFTRQRYETIYTGQPAADVQRTLGEPTVEFDNEWSYVNTSPFYKANIYFRDGRVIKKLWFDEKEMPRLPSSDELQQ